MDTLTAITVPSEEIDSATRALASALASDPELDILLAISEALAALSDVTPPYPPLPAQHEPIEVRVAVAAALRELRAAIDTATTPAERLRLAHVVRILQPLDEARPV